MNYAYHYNAARKQAKKKAIETGDEMGFIQACSICWLMYCYDNPTNFDRITASNGIFNFSFQNVNGNIILTSI